MKKSEKTEITREKIMSASLQEFGTKGFDAGTLNNICAENGISKGLLYHNFSGKDDIYLKCVKLVLGKFTEELNAWEINGDLNRYMEMRFTFFHENQLYSRIFFEAILQPPKHLYGQIRELKKDFDEINLKIYRQALEALSLRPGISIEEAVEYFNIIQDMFNGYFSSPAYGGTEFDQLVWEHENKLGKVLDLMLYGIAKNKDGNLL